MYLNNGDHGRYTNIQICGKIISVGRRWIENKKIDSVRCKNVMERESDVWNIEKRLQKSQKPISGVKRDKTTARGRSWRRCFKKYVLSTQHRISEKNWERGQTENEKTSKQPENSFKMLKKKEYLADGRKNRLKNWIINNTIFFLRKNSIWNCVI